MDTRSRSRWFGRGLLTISALGLVVDLIEPRARVGTIALVVFGAWCVRRVLARIDESSEQFEQAFRLGQEIEQRRIALDRELAPVRELVRQQDDGAAGSSSCTGEKVIDLAPRVGGNPNRARAVDDEPAKAIVMATVRARRRRRHRRRP